jgi:hypothetical protein
LSLRCREFAVTAGQAASFCKDGLERERTLLAFEIDAFSDVIAMLCSG